MKTSLPGILQCIVSLVSIATTTAEYRNYEIEIAINFFGILENDSSTGVPKSDEGVITPEGATKKYCLRVQDSVDLNKPNLGLDFGSWVGDHIAVIPQLKESKEAAAYIERKNLKKQSRIGSATASDMVKLFDPINNDVTKDLVEKFQNILFVWMDRDGNHEVSFEEFAQVYSNEIKALPNNELDIVFKLISTINEHKEDGKISWIRWTQYSAKFSLLSILTHNRLFSYEESDIAIARNFFKELDKDGESPGNGHLSSNEAGDKHFERLSKAKAHNKRMLATAFQSWIECFINASRDVHLVINEAVLGKLDQIGKIEDIEDQLEEEEMAVLVNPANEKAAKQYNLIKDLPRILFAWMDLDGSGDIIKDEFMAVYGNALNEGKRDKEKFLLALFDSIRKTKSKFGKPAINLPEWEKHCAGFPNMPSILSQRTVMAA